MKVCLAWAAREGKDLKIIGFYREPEDALPRLSEILCAGYSNGSVDIFEPGGAMLYLDSLPVHLWKHAQRYDFDKQDRRLWPSTMHKELRFAERRTGEKDRRIKYDPMEPLEQGPKLF